MLLCPLLPLLDEEDFRQIGRWLSFTVTVIKEKKLTVNL